MADKINFHTRQEQLGAGQQTKVSTDNCSLKYNDPCGSMNIYNQPLLVPPTSLHLDSRRGPRCQLKSICFIRISSYAKKSLHPFFLSKEKRMMVSTALRYLADQLYDFIRRLYSFKFLRNPLTNCLRSPCFPLS